MATKDKILAQLGYRVSKGKTQICTPQIRIWIKGKKVIKEMGWVTWAEFTSASSKLGMLLWLACETEQEDNPQHRAIHPLHWLKVIPGLKLASVPVTEKKRKEKKKNSCCCVLGNFTLGFVYSKLKIGRENDKLYIKFDLEKKSCLWTHLIVTSLKCYCCCKENNCSWGVVGMPVLVQDS